MNSARQGGGNQASEGGRADARPLPPDSLSTGVTVLLSAAIAQRLIGLLRSTLFCSFLEDDELGRWSLALIFLMVAAPLAALGLPGSFGRYVERYRRRGRLRMLIRRTGAVTASLSLAAAIWMTLAPRWFARCIFRDGGQWRLVLILGVVLLAVIARNFVAELLSALRQVRVVSLMQLTSSLVFAGLSVGLIYFTPLREEAVIAAFGAGALAASLVGAIRLRTAWRLLPDADADGAHDDLWRRLLPFAAWVWLDNLLANLFAGADQYMIKYFSGLDPAAADSLVGQYHCSRIVPVLLVGAAAALSTLILPYVSFDWERGRRAAVSRRLNLTLKLVGLLFVGAAALILLAAPLLFEWVWGGRYDGGLAVLPWTLVYCIWFSLGLIAANYLWCAERAKLGGLALALGLALNIVLNLLLLPRFGLLGAVLATAAANAAALALIYEMSRRRGMTADRGVWIASLLPLSIPLGPGVAAGAVLAAAWGALRGGWLLNEREKEELAEALRSRLGKLVRPREARDAASA